MSTILESFCSVFEALKRFLADIVEIASKTTKTFQQFQCQFEAFFIYKLN